MARVLEGAELHEHHAVPEVDVRARGIDAELHPQRAILGELLGQATLRQRVDGALEQAPRTLRNRRVRHRANARLTRLLGGVAPPFFPR